MATNLPSKPASGSNWDVYGSALDTVVREIQALPPSGLTLTNVLSSVVTRRRPVLITGLVNGADNTATLNNAFAAAQPYDTLVIPSGQWTHSASIQVPASNPNVRIEGQGRMAELIGTVPRYGGFRVLANGTSLVGIKHTVTGATARGNGENYDDCPFSVWNVSDIVLEDLVSTGSRDASFFISTAARVTATRMLGRDSFADGFHISNGSTDVVADGIDMVNVGDDGVAVVSYANETPCARIMVRRVNVVNGAARGFSIVGGTDIDYHDFKVFRSRGAGLYVGVESNGDFTTSTVSRARISQVSLQECNWDSGLDHGAAMLINQRSGTTVTDVRIAGLRATGMRKNADSSVYCTVKNNGGAGGKFNQIVLQDWTLDKGTGTAGQLYVDGLTSTTNKATGSGETYTSATGTGVVTNDEGYKVYGANSGIGTTASSATAPDLTVQRVRTALVG